jgi:hypothetical protein
MHHSDFDADRALGILPAHRRVSSGRTFDRSWTPGESAMITRYAGPRVNGWDVAGWIGSAVMLLGAAWMVWG